jgi:hypothetical protein
MKAPIQEPSAIEKATADVMHTLNATITGAHRAHGVQLTEREFRVMLAGHFEQKTIKDWCADFGVPLPKGDQRT